jgi:hypothetical protein
MLSHTKEHKEGMDEVQKSIYGRIDVTGSSSQGDPLL